MTGTRHRIPANSDPVMFFTEQMLAFAASQNAHPQASQEAIALAEQIKKRQLPPKDIADRLRHSHSKYQDKAIALATHMIVLADTLDPENATRPAPQPKRRTPPIAPHRGRFEQPPAQQEFWWQKL